MQNKDTSLELKGVILSQEEKLLLSLFISTFDLL